MQRLALEVVGLRRELELVSRAYANREMSQNCAVSSCIFVQVTLMSNNAFTQQDLDAARAEGRVEGANQAVEDFMAELQLAADNVIKAGRWDLLLGIADLTQCIIERVSMRMQGTGVSHGICETYHHQAGQAGQAGVASQGLVGEFKEQAAAGPVSCGICKCVIVNRRNVKHSIALTDPSFRLHMMYLYMTLGLDIGIRNANAAQAA